MVILPYLRSALLYILCIPGAIPGQTTLKRRPHKMEPDPEVANEYADLMNKPDDEKPVDDNEAEQQCAKPFLLSNCLN